MRAGRKEATTKRVARAKAAKISTDGDVLPLDVMVEAMREAYRRKDLKEAAAYAKEAAPYLHPKLSSIEAKHRHDFSKLSDDELDAELAAFGAVAGAGAAAGEGEA